MIQEVAEAASNNFATKRWLSNEIHYKIKHKKNFEVRVQAREEWRKNSPVKLTVSAYEQQPWHIVDPSPWPIMVSFSLFVLVWGLIVALHGFGEVKLPNGWQEMDWTVVMNSLKSQEFFRVLGFAHLIFYVIFSVYSWLRDVGREGFYEGKHNLAVQENLKDGFFLFVFSETMLFVGLFWSYFHFALNPSIWIGNTWPPVGMIGNTVNPWTLPLVNTALLVGSGYTVNAAVKAMRVGGWAEAALSLMLTIFYGSLFLYVQYFEFNHSPFAICDSVYGSIFFFITGFHGFHVVVGMLALSACLVRHLCYHFLQQSHLGMYLAAIYWHFVDIVWIFVYVIVYHWGR